MYPNVRSTIFLNVSSFEVDANNGLMGLPVRAGRGGKGRKKKKRVIEEEMREEWSQHGDATVMEVWQKRYGQLWRRDERKKNLLRSGMGNKGL